LRTDVAKFMRAAREIVKGRSGVIDAEDLQVISLASIMRRIYPMLDHGGVVVAASESPHFIGHRASIKEAVHAVHCEV
jgi:hypothetical protein